MKKETREKREQRRQKREQRKDRKERRERRERRERKERETIVPLSFQHRDEYTHDQMNALTAPPYNTCLMNLKRYN